MEGTIRNKRASAMEAEKNIRTVLNWENVSESSKEFKEVARSIEKEFQKEDSTSKKAAAENADADVVENADEDDESCDEEEDSDDSDSYESSFVVSDDEEIEEEEWTPKKRVRVQPTMTLDIHNLLAEALAFRQARGIESMDLEDTVEQMLKTEWQLDASMINNGIPDFVFEEFKTKCEGRTMFTKDFIAKLRTNNNTTTN